MLAYIFNVHKIVLSGDFGWEITPQSFKESLDSAKGGDVEILIASPGGSVFSGIDIYNQISDYKRKNKDSQMMLVMSGVVASMAAYMSMNPAFDLITVEDNAAFMVHNAWTMSVGDQHQLRKDADKLEGLSAPMTKLVSVKMGISENEAEVLLKEETWFFGQQIVDAGFADEVISRPEGSKDRNKISASDELKKIQQELSKKIYTNSALRAVATIKNHKVKNNMSEKTPEITKDEVDVLAIEKDRVKSLYALKEKYKETQSNEIVSKIVDDAVLNGDSIETVNRDLVLAATNGNTQASLESPAGTPQGSSETVSGEKPNQKKFDHKGKW